MKLVRHLQDDLGLKMPPVSLEAAAEALGAEIRTTDRIGKLSAFSDALSAPTIVYLAAGMRPMPRKRAIAIQLGEIAWHRSRNINSYTTLPGSRVADPERDRWILAFAAELLMPTDFMGALVYSGSTLSQIARRLHVSEVMVLEKVSLGYA